MSGYFKNLFCLALLLCVAGVSAVSTVGQDRRPPKDPPAKERPPTPGPEPPGFFNDGVTSERSMLVDPGVAIKLCVAEGNLKINGWKRDEVRVFVRNGRRFGMKPQEKSPESGKVNWLWILYAPSRPGRVSECLAGDSIEIDAPIGASFDLEGHSAKMYIDSIKKVKVRTARGLIMLRNITGGITANTNEGDVMVDNSAGAIQLDSTSGNIVAVDVKPGQIGELLKAKTNGGAITLQRVEHRQIQANTITGSLLFDGKFLTGGIYNFRTSNGSIKLAIPASSSCMVKAIYGAGQFESEIPLTIISDSQSPRLKTVVGRMGSGENAAAVSLTTSSGSIGIRKSGKAAGKP
ncbi:MAG TPA: DUF4097 family beta strand repeat-containing protein [Pyrinomonadaceae bacterium]|nr:DUF4097 family beta strand repeat-containing protein [Pyrinomonadaceae bacterium]